MSGIVTALSTVVTPEVIYNIFIDFTVVLSITFTISLSIYLIYKVIKGVSKEKADV